MPNNMDTVSLGFPSNRSSSNESMSSLSSQSSLLEDRSVLTPEGLRSADPYTSHVYDCSAFVIYCPFHKKIALSRREDGIGFWLPFVAQEPTDTWQKTAGIGISRILSNGNIADFSALPDIPISKPTIINVLRVQLPKVLKFIVRVTFGVRLTLSSLPGWTCCVDNANVQWVAVDELRQIDNLWGPEPLQLMAPMVAGSEANFVPAHSEYSVEEALAYAPNERKNSTAQELMKSAVFHNKDIEKLYSDFVQHCYPSFAMSLTSFTEYLKKVGWAPNDPRFAATFRAFNFRRSGFLKFDEFILGLAAMDQATDQAGYPGKARCGYIFRYFDENDDDYWEFADFHRMLQEVDRAKAVGGGSTSDEGYARTLWEALKVNDPKGLDYKRFLAAVAKKEIRGTSHLFRAPVAILRQISRKAYESIQNFGATQAGVRRRRYKGVCPGCRAKKYTIAIHSLRLTLSGRLVDPKNLGHTEGQDLTFKTEDLFTEQLRTYSKENVFSSNSTANILLDSLRAFKNSRKGQQTSGQKVAWYSDRNTLLDALTNLCRQAEEIFSQEPRVVKVNAPCYVLGDIHGNFDDLMTFEDILWKLCPTSPASYLFLGDYVDRGEYGVECVTYLFAMKVLAPEKFFMCRGNHEVRGIQRMFTFHKECTDKYGSIVGPQVWETINRVFDRLPIAAIVDESIYCAHGGIPKSISLVDELLKIPTPLPDPEAESDAAWEIMWNDPLNPSDVRNVEDFSSTNLKHKGFIPNRKRGTAYYYTEEAVNNFLELNGLSHIIRAHEVMMLGYKFHMSGKVITVFSCSNYCRMSNKAACIFLDSEKIRVIRLET